MTKEFDNEESILINPDEVNETNEEVQLVKRRKVVNELPVIKDNPVEEEYINTGGKACINFETMGRFDLPKTMYFDSYTTEDVNDFALSRPDDMLENLVVILDKRHDHEGVSVKDALMEEFLEILISIKMNFYTTQHEHRWICECQNNVTDGKQVANSTMLDLKELHHSSIEDAERELRKFYKGIFDVMTEDELSAYYISKYKGDIVTEEWSIDDELKSIEIREPFNHTINNDVYTFRFMRVKDLINGSKYARDKFAGKIKRVQNEQLHGMDAVEVKDYKEDKLQKIKESEAKLAMLYTQALTLIKKNGKSLTDAEKIEEYKVIPDAKLSAFKDFLNSIEFGINEEKELPCPICGNSSKRLLRQEFSPFELLPFGDDTTDEVKRSTGLNIHFGI